MSVFYRFLIFTIMAFSCSVAISGTPEDPAKPDVKGLAHVSGVSCNASEECILALGSADSIVRHACDSPAASVAWNRKREGAFLLVCECECTSYDNTGWLVDINSKTGMRNIQGLYLGKNTTVEGLIANSGSISDMFASHPLCEDVDSKKAKESVFISLIKQPTNSGSNPYCFYPAYIMEDNDALVMRTNNSRDEFGRLLQVKDQDSELEKEILDFLDTLVAKGHI